MRSFIIETVVIAAWALGLVAAGPVGESPAGVVETRVDNTGLHDRSLEPRNGMLYCGNFASGNGAMANELLAEVMNENTLHTIGATGCLRVKCRDTTAIYACNDNPHSITIKGKEIEVHGENILQRCCIHSSTGSMLYGYSMAGQQFTNADGGNWNVIIGYGDCNHSDTEKPSVLGGWGVNTSCKEMSEYIG
ncbi:hypothetical protein M406DRAFT_72943 [Cryphonectria parasitica EP155]|uniref:Effector protein n=1 Tax=Cryphonectria parasitica (strain ATCC 38755 / EP155) TaxID=660469 RepID=A0A9P4XSD7_CRYP1|nr:uncharacterized protein M406DRAFT_72943 [Cryphonectria parasitica EP155]KAF3760449.1 hypothetical protein M406DRAFT_72943 [Cryphonectria parasitica EP155]